jgi:putative transposase
LIECLYRYRAEERYLLHEFVVMPNHIHLIVTPRGITIERAMQLIKGGFSYRAKREFGWKGSVWIRSFNDRRLRDAEEYDVRRRYVWENPVNARLCAQAEDWPFSSACGRFELDPVPQRLKPLVKGRGTHG